MLQEKRKVQESIRARFAGLARLKEMSDNSGADEDPQKTMALLAEMTYIEMIERRVSNLPTWPFDTRIRESFIAIFLSVTATVLLESSYQH
jgi:hypothetical protein